MINLTEVASAILVVSLVAAIGLFLGSFKVGSVSLGIAGILFSGLAFGHFGATISPELLEFLREFGLVLFVYSIGSQLGPGFFASFKKIGLRLNLLAAAVVLLGALIVVLLRLAGWVQTPVASGLFSGATTNTPSLAAALEALKDAGAYSEELLKLPSISYAIAYPFGILGIILTMLGIRTFFGVKVAEEVEKSQREHGLNKMPLSVTNFLVKNPNLDGQKIREIAEFEDGVVISRLRHGSEVSVASPESVVRVGDVLLAVGPMVALEKLRIIVGEVASEDLRDLDGAIQTRRIVVSHKPVIGKTVEGVGILQKYGVTVTRVIRSDVEIPVMEDLLLQFGDVLVCVGHQDGLNQAARDLGNSVRALQHPELIPIFIGVALGVLLGSVPWRLPWVPSPVKLGLAGGPLLVAILLSRVGKIGPVVWYLPQSANAMLREIGITLFLTCVGLKSGDRFVSTLLEGPGFLWMGYGVLVTLIPLVIVGTLARKIWKLDYPSLCGLLAGSMTDPPALAFANSMGLSSVPALTYATVYPLTMILRVLIAQLLVLFLS